MGGTPKDVCPGGVHAYAEGSQRCVNCDLDPYEPTDRPGERCPVQHMGLHLRGDGGHCVHCLQPVPASVPGLGPFPETEEVCDCERVRIGGVLMHARTCATTAPTDETMRERADFQRALKLYNGSIGDAAVAVNFAREEVTRTLNGLRDEVETINADRGLDVLGFLSLIDKEAKG